MIPLALVALVVAAVFIIRSKEWLLGAFVFLAGVLCAGTPAGLWLITNLNTFVDWIASWSIFHR